MEVKNHILYENGNPVTFKKSPNVSGIKNPIYIIIHYDAAPNATSAINWMTNPASKVSADLHIDRDGNITQIAPFNVVTWHAGVSSWKGLSGLNSHSIGIELQNTGTQEYTEKQCAKLAQCCKAIVENYPIREILGHSDIAPGRKIDPGKQFPMKWLRDTVFNQIPNNSKNTIADLNLRKGAGTQFESIQILKKGTEVNILSESNGWSEVFACDIKLKGWVSNNYIK